MRHSTIGEKRPGRGKRGKTFRRPFPGRDIIKYIVSLRTDMLSIRDVIFAWITVDGKLIFMLTSMRGTK